MKQFGSLLMAGLSLTFATLCFSKQPEEAFEHRVKQSAQRLLDELVDEAKDSRLPIPDAAAVKEARDLVKEALSGDYRIARYSLKREELIDKLFSMYREEPEPVRGYALLMEANEVASRDVALGLVMKVIDATATRYQQDATQKRTEFLSPRKDGNDKDRLFDLAIETACRGVGDNSFDAAKAAASLAEEIAEAICAKAKLRQETLKQKIDEAKEEFDNAEGKWKKEKAQDRFRPGQIQGRADSGQDRFRTGQIQDRTDSG